MKERIIVSNKIIGLNEGERSDYLIHNCHSNYLGFDGRKHLFQNDDKLKKSLFDYQNVKIEEELLNYY